MKRSQFTFYRSYFEAIKSLSKRDMASVILAICAYALDEEEPNLTGVPLAVFTLIRPTLDSGRRLATNASGQRKKRETNGEQNGKQNESKRATNREQNESKAGTEEEPARREKENERENEIETENEYELELEAEDECPKRARAREGADPAPPAPADADGNAGMPERIEAHRRAEALIRRYSLPDSDVSLQAVLEDAERVGFDRLEDALRRAAQSNSRPMLSVNYYRAILAGKGAAAPRQDTLLRYSQEERRATYSAALVDFDGE